MWYNFEKSKNLSPRPELALLLFYGNLTNFLKPPFIRPPSSRPNLRVENFNPFGIVGRSTVRPADGVVVGVAIIRENYLP